MWNQTAMIGHVRGMTGHVHHRNDRPETRRRTGALRYFGRNQNGATAIEFAFISVPFLALLIGIMEMALMFWTNQILDEAVTRASRTLLTGEARGLYTGTNAADSFKREICRQAPALIDCTKLSIDVRTYDNGNAGVQGRAGRNPVRNGRLDTSGFGYTEPGAGRLVVVTAVLDYKLLMPTWAIFGEAVDVPLVNIGNGHRALVASTAFQSEPFT